MSGGPVLGKGNDSGDQRGRMRPPQDHEEAMCVAILKPNDYPGDWGYSCKQTEKWDLTNVYKCVP